jgi:hypothetical protein
MEPERLLSCSLEPATDLHPERDESSHTLPPYVLRHILILSSHLCLGLSGGFFPSGFVTNISYAFLISLTCYIPRPSHLPWFHHTNNLTSLIPFRKVTFQVLATVPKLLRYVYISELSSLPVRTWPPKKCFWSHNRIIKLMLGSSFSRSDPSHRMSCPRLHIHSIVIVNEVMLL